MNKMSSLSPENAVPCFF